MNHLAHLFLAEPTPPMMLGSLLADFVKGNAHLSYPADVQAGIAQHRLVDAFTDAHPLVHRSIGRISRKWGWFSGIIIDVAYDHFLARNWHAFTDIPLRQFTQAAYEALQQQEALMPDTMQSLIRRMVAEDRLMAYRRMEGVEQTLGRISWRMRQKFKKREIRMEHAVEDLREAEEGLEADFLGFFPELRAHAHSSNQPEAPARAG